MAGKKANPADKTAQTGSGAAGKDSSTGSASDPLAGKGSAPAQAQDEAPARRRRRGWLWLIVPILVAGAAGVWFAFFQEYSPRIDRLEARLAQTEELAREMEKLQRRHRESAALAASEARAAQLAAERVRDALEVRLGAAERRLEAVGRLPAEQGTAWKLDAADRLLALADFRNRFAGDHEGAALAAREALDLLEQAGDPRYYGLRAEIEEQARTLERIPARDIEGVVVRIGALILRIEGIDPPVRPASAAASAEDLPEEEGWARAVASARRALRSLIVVRRADSSARALLTDTDADTLRHLMAAELHLARLAFIQGDMRAYSAALAAARGRLARLYAPDDADVAATLEDIDELLEAGQARETPDIAASLRRFRALRAD